MEPTQLAELSKQLRNEIIIYVLNFSSLKYAIKQADLISLFDENKKMFKNCFDEARQALENCYGIIMVEIPDAKSGKKYLTYSEMAACSPFEYNTRQKSEITLLFIILSYIFMHGGSILEERIEEFLKSLKIYYYEEHPYFGDNIKKQITEKFVKQYYLTKTKAPNDYESSDLNIIYAWGLRSELEFPKQQVLEATAKILDMPVHMFPRQMLMVEGKNMY